MINMTNNKLFSEGEEPSISNEAYIVGEGSVILTLMINQQMTVEREGVSWRTVPKEKLTAQAAEQMMRTWHNAKGEVITPEFSHSSANAIVVSMMIAGFNNIHLFSVYPSDELLVVFNHQTSTYVALPPQLFPQLMPAEIFN